MNIRQLCSLFALLIVLSVPVGYTAANTMKQLPSNQSKAIKVGNETRAQFRGFNSFDVKLISTGSQPKDLFYSKKSGLIYGLENIDGFTTSQRRGVTFEKMDI